MCVEILYVCVYARSMLTCVRVSVYCISLNTKDTTFRFFKMELIAGEDEMETEVKECGCRYRLAFDKVYWNSRLHREHSRIVEQLKKEDVVADMMAGIGPFAMPAAKFGCKV